MPGPPHPLRLLLEARAASELAAFTATAPAMAALLPRAPEPRHVLVLPGFMAGDGSTQPLRLLLSALGHRTHGWGLGRNIGPTNEIIEGMVELIEELDRSHGPIDIVGWSLGGLFAREIARLAPDTARQVITLGSPFQTSGPHESHARAAFVALRDRHSEHHVAGRLPSWARDPIEVPTTSIYSRTDGIVNWHQCLNRDRPLMENIEVYGSHCGLGHNPAAVYAIADRLAWSGTDWRPFRAPKALRPFFPRPAQFDTELVAAA